MEVNGFSQTNLKQYAITCFNCGANIQYKETEIHRSPIFNMAVKKHGFKGHTGEVHCPSCGTWLPHYEENILTQ